MKQESITKIVLDAIEFELDDQQYCNGLDNSHWKDWTEQQKFDWAFNLYKATVGRYESEPYKSVEYWLSGLGLHVPFESYKIQQMGFNSETWFKELALELIKQVKAKPCIYDGTLIS